MDREQKPTVNGGDLLNPAAIELQQQWEPLARRLARRFAVSAECEDLEQVARLALWQAVQRFDPARGCHFSSFAIPTIAGALRRHMCDLGPAVRIPRRWWELRPRLKRVADLLTQSLGCDPSVSELAERLGVSEEDVVGAMAVPDLLHPVSLDEFHEGPEGQETEALSERIGTIDPLLEDAELRIVVRQALEGLPSDLRDLLERRYFHGQTEREIARIMGVSQTRISRLERRALIWLWQELRDLPLFERHDPTSQRRDEHVRLVPRRADQGRRSCGRCGPLSSLHLRPFTHASRGYPAGQGDRPRG